MKTFIIISPGFANDEGDTSCLPAFQQFILSINKLFPDLNVVLIALQYPFIQKKYKWFNNRIVSVGGRNKKGLNKIITWIKAYSELKKICKSENVIGVLSLWLDEASLLGDFFCRRQRLTHYMWLIGQDAKIGNRYIKRIKPDGKKVIAMSEFLQATLYKNYKIKAELVVQNGIIENSFPPLNVSERKIDVLGVGWLTSLKNYSLFIDVIFELSKALPTIRATIVGSGDEESRLKQKVKALNLEHNITFTGLITHSEVFQLMNNSKCFLHTSHYEGNSTVLMEALYSGNFVVSTQPLSNQTVKNLYVTSDKSEMINQLLNKLISQPFLSERVIFNTMDNSVKKIMDLYL